MHLGVILRNTLESRYCHEKRAIATGGGKEQFPAMAVLAMQIAKKYLDIADEPIIFHNGVKKSNKRGQVKFFHVDL